MVDRINKGQYVGHKATLDGGVTHVVVNRVDRADLIGGQGALEQQVTLQVKEVDVVVGNHGFGVPAY